MNPITLAQAIPRKARAGIYSALATLYALEAIWDFVDASLESRIVASLGVLGFGIALSNTR